MLGWACMFIPMGRGKSATDWPYSWEERMRHLKSNMPDPSVSWRLLPEESTQCNKLMYYYNIRISKMLNFPINIYRKRFVGGWQWVQAAVSQLSFVLGYVHTSDFTAAWFWMQISPISMGLICVSFPNTESDMILFQRSDIGVNVSLRKPPFKVNGGL